MLTSTEAVVQANCAFYVDRYYGYACAISQIFIGDLNDQVTISGTHLEGYNDARVSFLQFTDTSMIRIPQEFCDKFRNLRQISAVQVNLQSLVKLTNCEKLEVLNLNKNQISYLEPGFLSHLQNFQLLNMEDNLLTELKEGALDTATVNKDLEFLFMYNPIERIEGTINNTAFFKNINFKGAYLNAIDPKFLYGFLGRIAWLQLGGKCPETSLITDITAGTVGSVRSYLQKCFNNFVPNETEPPTEEPTREPTEDPIIPTTRPSEPGSSSAEVVCTADASKEFYNCEMSIKMKLTFRN